MRLLSRSGASGGGHPGRAVWRDAHHQGRGGSGGCVPRYRISLLHQPAGPATGSFARRHRDCTDPSLVDEGPVESRVDAAIRSLVRMAYEHEPVLRTHQKSNDNYPLRKGRRIAWLDRALAPLKCLSPRQRTALSMLYGVEAMI